MTETVTKRLQLEAEIKQGLENNEFVIYYEPQFSCKTGNLIGAEALVRWDHPTRGLVPPLDFIPVAEETGQIDELGHFVAFTAARQCVTWWEQGLPEFVISFNLSPKQLHKNCSDKLTKLLDDTKIPIEKLEMEVTESLIMTRGSVAIDELNKMKDKGLSIAMDDFGTGYSSLAQLKNLPISKLKIDRSFVCNLPEDEDDATIVRTIIAMAKALGLHVIAEGVETDAQKNFLINEGCNDLQGYLLGRPVDAESFRRLLEKHKGTTVSCC